MGLLNMILECLALWNDIQVYLSECWEHGKYALRDWLGPGARKWYITPDNQITHIPVQNSIVFCSIRNRFGSENNIDSEQKGKRLPWLAIVVKHCDEIWDISEWISEIRVLLECPIPSLLQIVRLAARLHHIHVYETSQTNIFVTNRDGEDEMYVFQGTIALEKHEE